MLEITNVAAAHGSVTAVHDVTIDVADGQVVTLLGPNGAGKTSLLLAISGVLRPTSGRVVFDGVDITGATPDRIARAGIAHVPEGRHLFPQLTVSQNIRVGYDAGRHRVAQTLEEASEELFTMFPVLGTKRNVPAASLSGGEQQMLALARGLASSPRMLMIDELSIGLAPIVVDQIYERLRAVVAQRSCSVLLVEQYTRYALALADHAYVLQRGCVIWSGSAVEAAADGLAAAYLGVA